MMSDSFISNSDQDPCASSGTGDAGRFLGKALLLLALFYGLTLTGSLLFNKVVDWRAWQDPRRRLLWDKIDPSSQIILLGDSAFISGYVNSADQTLWKVMEGLIGRPVFNGTLDGAEPPDFLKAGKLIAQQDGQGKFVFLNIIPTRFLKNRAPKNSFGNYPTQFNRKLGENAISQWLVAISKPLLILDSDVLISCIKRKEYYKTKEFSDMVWKNDGGRALSKFLAFEKYWLNEFTLNSFDWIPELDSILKSRGYKLVLVLTPVNNTLLQEYARVINPQECQRLMDYAHETLTRHLQRIGIPFVDAYRQFSSEEFADLIHTNSRGDSRLAQLMVQFLDQQPSFRSWKTE